MKRYLISMLSLLVLVTGCKYGTSKGVKEPYKNLLSILKQQSSEDQENLSKKFMLRVAKDIKKESLSIIRDVNRTPKFTRKYYAIESDENVDERLSDMQARITATLDRCTEGSMEIQKLIHSIGRQQYEITKKQGIKKITDDAAMSEVIALYALQYTKRVYETCSSITYHYMNELSVEKYDSLDHVLSYRDELLSKFFGLTGMIKVINRDSQTVLKRITSLDKAKLLSQLHTDLVNNLVVEIESTEQQFTKFTNDIIQDGFTQEMLNEYEKLQKENDKVFADKTILFDPANPDHAVVNVLVVLSNLTWGSIQSGLGLGIILTHTMIVTPLSWVLSPLFPDYFTPLRGPSIKMSHNGNQVYANLCGFPAIRSKMSMGIWELDFCMGYKASSGHEGGHAKQSALLGPLYLPAAILSYTINGGHGGFIESWADSWHAH